MAPSDSPTPPSENASADRLDGWKEIATYLRRNERTVQRWEDKGGMPIHRHRHEKGSTVFAYKSELDAWWDAGGRKLDSEPDADPEPAPERPRATSKDKVLLGVVTAVLALIAVVAGREIYKRAESVPETTVVRLAVLPFEDLAGDPQGEFFRKGLTMDMITELGGTPNLNVIGYVTVEALKKQGKTARQIGRELNVEYVLQGTVRRDPSKVRITAELVDARTEAHVWAESFDQESPLENLLELQSGIAQKVAGSLRRRIIPTGEQHPARHRQVNAKALEAYLLGRYHWSHRTADGLAKAVDYFQQSIELDPNYAPAHAGLADTYNTLVFYSILSSREGYPKARAAALRALELDPTLAEAHVSLAEVLFSHDYDPVRAEKEYQEAIALNPGHANAHHWFGLYLVMMGDRARALEEINRAVQNDPLSPIIRSNVALYYYYARDYERVLEECRRTLRDFDEIPQPYFWIARAHLERREFPESIAAFQKAIELDPTDLVTLALLGHAYGIAGQPQQARAVLGRLEKQARQNYVSPVLFGLVHLGLGDKQRAVQAAERAFAERAPLLTRIKVEPILEDLRAIPQFQELMRRMNLIP